MPNDLGKELTFVKSRYILTEGFGNLGQDTEMRNSLFLSIYLFNISLWLETAAFTQLMGRVFMLEPQISSVANNLTTTFV